MIPEPFSPERFEKFFEYVEFFPAPFELRNLGECWIWIGTINKYGYGLFHCPGFPRIDGKKITKNAYAHRWATVFWYGAETLHELTYDHLCLRKVCVNPRHGSAISRPDNTARGNQTRHIVQYEDLFTVANI